MYVLHESPDSASTMVRLVLEELGVPYRARLIDRAAGELASPAYRAMQPLGKIPAMETPDGVMFETAAILLYLSETHGRLAPQPGSPERAAFLKWFFFTSTNIHPTLLEIYYPCLLYTSRPLGGDELGLVNRRQIGGHGVILTLGAPAGVIENP